MQATSNRRLLDGRKQHALERKLMRAKPLDYAIQLATGIALDNLRKASNTCDGTQFLQIRARSLSECRTHLRWEKPYSELRGEICLCKNDQVLFAVVTAIEQELKRMRAGAVEEAA